MAGNYADPTSWMMALDRDGSVMTEYSPSAGLVYEIPNSGIVGVTKTASTVPLVPHLKDAWWCIIFPELRDIDAYFLADNFDGFDQGQIQTSVNTTNGMDGTWTTLASALTYPTSVTTWRTAIRAETALGVKGVRFWTPGSGNGIFSNLRALHLYGEVSPGSPDRLAFWSATADQKMSPATPDWGDVPRSSSDDFQVRVKNLSGTKTAGNVRVSFDTITDTTPSVPSQHMASLDGVTFFAQVNIGSLAPGAISAPVTIRRVTPSNAILGLWALRMSAVPDTWA